MEYLENNSNQRLNKGLIASVIAGILVFLFVSSVLIFVNYRIFCNAQSSVAVVVDKDLAFVVENASLFRSLGGISAETHLFLDNFLSNEAFDQQKKEHLLKEIYNLNTRFSGDETTESELILKNFLGQLEMVLIRCEELNISLKKIRKLDSKIAAKLKELSTTLEEKKMELVAEGGGQELVDRVTQVLPVYQDYSAKLANEIFRFNQIHVSALSFTGSEKPGFFKLLDEFDSSLVDLTISGAAFSGFGRDLRSDVSEYKRECRDYFIIVERFPVLMGSLNDSLKSVIELSGKIDGEIRDKSISVKDQVGKSMNSFILLSSGIFILFNLLTIALCFYIIKVLRITRLAENLQKALNEIKTLRGILPICAHCKRIRDDEGYWQRIESYIHEHSEADFSHGICPECLKNHYPDLDEEEV
jgi:hypothetical protein